MLRSAEVQLSSMSKELQLELKMLLALFLLVKLRFSVEVCFRKMINYRKTLHAWVIVRKCGPSRAKWLSTLGRNIEVLEVLLTYTDIKIRQHVAPCYVILCIYYATLWMDMLCYITTMLSHVVICYVTFVYVVLYYVTLLQPQSTIQGSSNLLTFGYLRCFKSKILRSQKDDDNGIRNCPKWTGIWPPVIKIIQQIDWPK